MSKPIRRILLVSPLRGSFFPKQREARAPGGLTFPSALMPPLELATLAALTPPEIEVDIWDESVRPPLDGDTHFGKEYDLIGVTGYMAHLPWAIDVADIAHRRGIPVVIGGPGVSGSPERCRRVFDVVFIGEAELTWPQFLDDWKTGRHRSEYRQVQRPDMGTSPAPRWDGVADIAKNYLMGAVQTTRGCPFDCDFCDVIHLFGRQPRHKAVATVLAEVAALERLGVGKVFFCDDNFIGRPKYAKELLRELIPLNNSFERPMGFSTQLTVNIADDDELLELVADANFDWVLVGIESPREASLREANKPQNYKTDLVADIRKIQSYGIPVKGNMIVGFDHDDVLIFDETYDFVQKAGLLYVTVSMLKGFPGTPLLTRLQREGRIIETRDDIYSDTARPITNIIPKQMTRLQLFEGYAALLQRLASWDRFVACAKEFVGNVKRPPNVPRKTPPDWEKLEGLRGAVAQLDEETRTAVMEVVQAVFQKAPFMMEKMIGFLFRQGANREMLPRLLEALHERIAVESAPQYRPEIVRNLPSIPTGFKEAVQWEAFPKTYHLLREGLREKRLVTEGLIRVWKDFLIRWAPVFEGFEDFHHEHLRELCERAIEQGNAGQFTNAIVNAETDGLTGVQLRRLAGEVLVSVEQDLRGISGTSEIIPLSIGVPQRATA